MHDADTDKQALAERSVEAVYAPDRASKGLGMRVVSVAPRACVVAMTVRPDMANGLSICHGGIVFTLADSAFAFACNTDGGRAVAASASIDFLAAAQIGDELTASARALWHGGRSGIYEVTVTNQDGAEIALFRGRSHSVRARSPATGSDR
jgi:acyl-CoA thioesterase